MRTRWKVLIGIAAVLVFLAFAVAFLVDEPMRRATERAMNAKMTGYTARIGSLNFHPIGFAVDLRDVVIVQDAHPKPPVLRMPRLVASVQWSAIIHRRVVADFVLEGPEIYLDRTHVVAEAKDPTPVAEHGWQDALQAIYPLKLNQFRVYHGAITYVDTAQPDRPVQVRNIDAIARNIRNVKSKPDEFPSPLRVTAVVFERGWLEVEGDADFLREPYAAVKGTVDLGGVPLDYAKPVVARYGLTVTAGTLSLKGSAEVTPDVTILDLQSLQVDGLKADWAYHPTTAKPAAQAAKKTAKTAAKVSNARDVLIRARHLRLTNATVGFVNEETNPSYRAFLSHASLAIENFSNQKSEGLGVATLTGRFMGTGDTAVKATLRPETRGPDLEVDARIENTDMRAMNELLLAHGNFDVASGFFSVFSQMRVKDGRISGYVKPLFRDLQVYEKEQDREKSLGRRLRERVVDLAGKILKNRPRKEVATVARIEGPLEDPKADTRQVVLNLIRNAFIKAILPGFERESEMVAKRRSDTPAASPPTKR
jgi:hypothetical protein